MQNRNGTNTHAHNRYLIPNGWVESGKCGKEVKKLQKFEYFKNEKSFLDEIKTFFIVFGGLSFDEKIKI